MSLQARVWSTKEVNDFPDSSFAYIEPGGKKDGEGKTIPRGLRHFPYKDKNGEIDEPHVNAGFSYLQKANLPMPAKKRIHVVLINACKNLGKEHKQCSFPGCNGYSPSKKSFLEDRAAWAALNENYTRTRGMNVVFG